MNYRSCFWLTSLSAVLLILFFAPGLSFADKGPSRKNSSPGKNHNWRVITFANASSSGSKEYPIFSVRPDDGAKGFCLNVDFRDPAFAKPHMISARLYREDGQTVESVGGNLNAPAPAAVTVNTFVPNPGHPAPPSSEWMAQTSFPWGKNSLEESWIEISMGQDRYWLEIPYGFDRNPGDPLPQAITEKRPHFAAPIKKPTDQDHIVAWDQVSYDVLPVENGYSISLNLSNPGDAVGEVVLYQEKGAWDLHSPRTELKAIDGDGTEIKSRCTGIHQDEDLAYGRDDTFSFNRYPFAERCWGHIKVEVGAKTYRIVVPSSSRRQIT